MYLKKLALQDVYKLLENRYEVFRINTNQSFQSPIDDSIVDYLYKFFRGDLRAMLKGLEDVITDLMSNDIDNIVLPIGLNEFLPAINARLATLPDQAEASIAPSFPSA